MRERGTAFAQRRQGKRVTFSCKNETLAESESSVGVSKTNGNQVGFWAVGIMDVKAPKGEGDKRDSRPRMFRRRR